MEETWVQSLGQEVLLEKEMMTHFIILAWEIPWILRNMVSFSPWVGKRVGYDLVKKKNNKNIYIFQIFVLGNMITPFRISLRISAFILLFMVLETKIWALGIIIIGVLLHLDSFGGLKKLYIYIYVFVYIILYMC